MRQHFRVQPPAPGAFNAQLPASVDAVLLRALEKDPSTRFPSISLFAQAFDQAIQWEGDLRSTLALNEQEAARGTTRLLLLPGGRSVEVTVPANTQMGQVIYDP